MSIVIPEDIVFYCDGEFKEAHVTVSEWIKIAEKNHAARADNLSFKNEIKILVVKYNKVLKVLKIIAEFNADDAENKSSELCKELLEDLGELK